jgi:transposase-like protein
MKPCANGACNSVPPFPSSCAIAKAAQATRGISTRCSSQSEESGTISGGPWIRTAVLDILVQKSRDQRAATRFFRKLLKGLPYVPRLLVTDQLGSYGAAHRELLRSVTHCQGRRLNNRAEVSHQPTRQRERQMRRFGIVNVKLTKCERIQYNVFKQIMTALYCSHVRL